MNFFLNLFPNKKAETEIIDKIAPTNAIISKEISHLILKELLANHTIFEINKMMRLNKYHHEICNKEELWEELIEQYFFHFKAKFSLSKIMNDQQKTAKEKFRYCFELNTKSENLYKYKKSAENWNPFLIQLENSKDYLDNKKICMRAFELFKMGDLDAKTRRKLFQILYVNESQKKTERNFDFYLNSNSNHPHIVRNIEIDTIRNFQGKIEDIQAIRDVSYAFCVSEEGQKKK